MTWRRFLFLLLAPAVPVAQARIDERLGGFRAQQEVLYLWSGEHVRRLCPGFEGLMADVYWLRTVQYFGGQRLFARDKNFDLLLPLIEITTALDPRLEIAYRYGAVFLSEPWPFGAGRPEAGVALLDRGARATGSWRLKQDQGFFTFLFLKDARGAAAILLDASKMPGAAFWLETLAGQVLMQGGERDASREIWKRMYEQSEEGAIRQNALQHLKVLDALDGADLVSRLVAVYAGRKGRPPASLDELISAGLLRRPAKDPAGVPFEYDPETGLVRVSRKSPLWRP